MQFKCTKHSRDDIMLVFELDAKQFYFRANACGDLKN